jgi:hypothetical protein
MEGDSMLSTTVNIYKIKVFLIDGHIVFGGDMSDGRISVQPGLQLIHFKLETEGASFPTYPFQWLDGAGSPAAQPLIDLVQTINADQCQLVVFNAVELSGESEQKFSVAVVSGGQAYISDPTIICEPPVQ